MKDEAPHPEFQQLNNSVFISNNLIPKNIQVEEESQEYGALSFDLAGKKIKFRVGKITPKKVGFFVTLWKRIEGITTSYDSSDAVDFFMIAVRDENKHGFFFFPKSLLIKKGFISNQGKGGKRGFRIYPPWAPTVSQQAKHTQAWQVEHFNDASNRIELI